MTSPDFNRWQFVSGQLDRALDMDEDARTAWLATLDADDPALASELRVLLAEHRHLVNDRFLEDSPPLPVTQPTLVGQTFGAYRIEAPIGQGGMGTVWLASRSDGRFERQAAVKFLSIALTGRGDDRFRREGAIVARLTHPNIAQLLDAGVSTTGTPYLVLEHVDGEPIDHYCERLGFDVDARVRLFLAVLSAVEHAHANLIIHRDLKPSNVLVDRQGTVKLLDFGIAKLLEDEGRAGMATELTLAGGSPLTPEYAAPEQFTGEPATTATDVYALGVMLYQLLTGQHPFAAGRRSAADLLKAIVDTEAPRPSQVVSGDRMKRLRGDLDTIVAKAMKKRPADRYASVTAMADDLRRYLTHEPIGARPDTVAYRAAKFVRRNRWSVAAGALTIASLSIGLFVANRERALAQERFNQVRQLSNKLFEIDVQVRQLPGNTKTRELIVDTALDYLKKLAVNAGADPDLAVDVGTAYMRVARVQGVPISANLGQLDRADQTLQIAQRFIDSSLAARPRNRVAILRSAQIAHDRMILAGLRRPDDDAIRYAARSAERLEQYLTTGPVDPAEAQQVVIAYMNVANRYMLAGQLDEAVRLARRTIDVARANNQPLQAGAALMVVASALRAKGDLDEALLQAQESVRVLEPAPGESPPMGRIMSYTLALMREAAVLGDVNGVSMGRQDEALAVLGRARQALEPVVRKDPDEADSATRLVTVYTQLSDILSTTDPPRALKIYEESLALLAPLKNSKMRRDQARTLAGMAVLLQHMGRTSDARERLAKAFERLGELKLYPAKSVTLGSELDDALRARAEIEAGSGHLDDSVKTYQELTTAILAGKAEAETDLSDAAHLSNLYASTAAVARRAGLAQLAASTGERRLELWREWDRRLPNNPFVQTQLAAAQPSADR